MANKTTDGNPLKAKLGIFIEEQGATRVESLCKGTMDYESLRITGLEQSFYGRWTEFNCLAYHRLRNSIKKQVIAPQQ